MGFFDTLTEILSAPFPKRGRLLLPPDPPKTPTLEEIEEENRKSLLAATNLNSPGIKSQSVLNLR